MENKTNEQKEEWRQIKGFSRYEVSNLGRVRSNTKDEPKILKQVTTHQGYKHVTLMTGDSWGSGGKRVTKRVHRLVAEAFIPNPNNYEQIDHLDTDATNNNVSNLRWCTAKMNYSNPITLKKHLKNIEKASKTVLVYSKDYQLLSAFTSTADAARQLNLSQGNISSCCMGSLETYKGLIFTFKPIGSEKDHERILKKGEDKKIRRLHQVNMACKKMYHSDIEEGRRKAREYYHKNIEKSRARGRKNYYKRKHGQESDTPQ